MGLLSLAIWLPIAFGVLLLALGRDEQRRRWCAGSRWSARRQLLVTLPLITGFDTGTAAMQFVENQPWIERFNVQLPPGRRRPVGVVRAADGLHHGHRGHRRLGGHHRTRGNQYMGAFLILSGLMVGVFTALDGLLFYVFFEATLIPMYIIIGVWGGRGASTRRSSSSSTRCWARC
jgi:NADH-quinone oxidoreductase subunit M